MFISSLESKYQCGITISMLLLIVFFGAGCASKPVVKLVWEISQPSYYRMTREPFPTEMELDVDAMLTNPTVMDNKVSELKGLALDAKKFPMLLTLNSVPRDLIKVLAVNSPVADNSIAQIEVERQMREMQKQLAGVVQLNTVIDKFGKNKNLHTKQQQYNLVSIIFRLPVHPVAVGDSWELPIVLTRLNTPFLADQTDRINKVWVRSITDQEGIGSVAEIVYLLQEKISGFSQIYNNEKPKPFKIVSTYFAVGDFVVSEHRWLRYIGRLEADMGLVRTADIIAILPTNKGAQ